MAVDYFPVAIGINTALAVGGAVLTYNLIPKLAPMFIKANLFGIDMSKTSGAKV
jgi:hypothetical protein